MQRVLVLGATGFIGSRLAAALAGSAWATPICAGRRVTRTPTGGIALSFDATSADNLRGALVGIDAVVNCIAGDGRTIIESARALFDAARESTHHPRIVHMSSLAVYGDATGDVDESTALSAPAGDYGAAKRAAERSAAAYPAAVVFRPGIVYGPGSSQWSARIANLLYAKRLGDLGVTGDGWCNLVYIDDVVEAILRALQSSATDGKIFNLSMPNPITWNEYFIKYAMALEAVPVARISARTLKIESKILAPPQKIAEILANKIAPGLTSRLPPPIPPSLVRLFGQEIRMRVDAVEKALGLAWTGLDDGLRQAAVRYHRSSTDTDR